MTTTIYGASDDLIELDGDLSEEFAALTATENDEGAYIALSNGVLLRVRYDRDGVWRFTPVHGAEHVTISYPNLNAGEYTERVTVGGERVTWAVHGSEIAIAR